MTHVALVLPYYSPNVATLAAMLERYALLRCLPQELGNLGYRVSVLALAAEDAERMRGGVRYLALRSYLPAMLLGRGLQRLKPHIGPAYWEPATRLAARLRYLQPEIVHVFGLTLDINLALLTRAAQHIGAPVVVHFHGGEPSSGKRIRRLQRYSGQRVAKVLFTHTEQARPWIAAGVIPAWEQVGHVIETSVEISPPPRAEAQAATGMQGDPICLSVGRLHPVKDPLTMLHGFAGIAAARPTARLYLYYQTGELEQEARACVAATPGLAERVEFRGRASAAEMPAIYASADLLLQASLREWSGLAVLEALACGCIPVISDIPAFRTLTGGGRVGRLFPVGEHAALAAAALSVAPAAEAPIARAFFARELSFTAMARQLDGVYQGIGNRGQATGDRG